MENQPVNHNVIMNKGMIRVFRVVPAIGGDPNLKLKPWIPENTADGEDSVTPRIPVCLTIQSAIEAAELIYDNNLWDTVYANYLAEFQSSLERIENEWAMTRDPDFIPTSFGTYHRHHFPTSARYIGMPIDVLTITVPATVLYHPTIDEVPDAWKTGELWLTSETWFEHYGRYMLRRHMKIPKTPYARYAVTQMAPDMKNKSRFVLDYCDEVCDRLVATAIYGEEDAFSFITMDPELAEHVDLNVDLDTEDKE